MSVAWRKRSPDCSTEIHRQVERELRLAAKDSKDNYHVSTILQFLTGLTAVLVKHLQDSPKRINITEDINKLAKIFQFQERL